MAEHLGLVLSTNDDKTAQVATEQKGFCRGCKDASKCRVCLAGTRHVTTVRNAVGARRGDMVSIYNEDAVLWAGAASLYVIPALWLMIGATIGAGLGVDWKIGETGGAVSVGLSGFAVGLMIVFIVSKSLKFGAGPDPRIIRIIEPPREGAEKSLPGPEPRHQTDFTLFDPSAS